MRLERPAGYTCRFVHFVGKDTDSILKETAKKEWGPFVGNKHEVTIDEVRESVPERVLEAGIKSVENGVSESFYLN